MNKALFYAMSSDKTCFLHVLLKALDAGLIDGICMACSRALGVYEANAALGLHLLDDMNRHAGIRNYVESGWEVVSI